MNILKSFLESSTIHGLVHVANNRSFIRLFWLMVVLTGFSIAGVLIQSSFENWAQSPIKTTIETKPIWDLKFPKVTVCPPKNSYTNLNYDLMTMNETTNLTKKERIEIGDHAYNVLQDSLHQKVIDDFFKIEEENRYQNLYYGLTALTFPQNENGFKLYIKTFASSGSFRTKFFGDKFLYAKVEKQYRIWIDIVTQVQALGNKDVTLVIQIEKVSMQVSGGSFDDVSVSNSKSKCESTANLTICRIPGPSDNTTLKFERFVTREDVKNNAKLGLMPGFRVKWFYEPKIDITLEGPIKFNTEFRRFILSKVSIL